MARPRQNKNPVSKVELEVDMIGWLEGQGSPSMTKSWKLRTVAKELERLRQENQSLKQTNEQLEQARSRWQNNWESLRTESDATIRTLQAQMSASSIPAAISHVGIF